MSDNRASEDEVRRAIAAELGIGRPMTLIDNLDSTGSKRMIRSPALASVLTTRYWADRRVRTSEMAELSNHALWVATGNNPSISMELARRSIRSRLDRNVDQPWRQGGFRHPFLLEWTLKHRGDLIWAISIFVENWKAQGAPRSTQLLGSFEDWSCVIGGILDSAGVLGFLGNLEELYESADLEGEEWRELVPVWWERYGAASIRVSELNRFCDFRDLMESIRGERSEKSQQTRLGDALLAVKDRVFGGYRIVLRHDGRQHKGKKWALVASGEFKSKTGT